MSGTVTRIGRAPAGTTAVATAATGTPATGGTPQAGPSPWRNGDLPIGRACDITVRRRPPGRTSVDGRRPAGTAGPDSTESPHAIRR
ncbi:hypothetical protein [Streptomyces sp. NRRL B-24484]|uniref:hypothetical protein n=1 Tax=Streptomyces sp. NRRL B-24484 TaxID=1463833 RepID=UPI0004BFF22A|nr:hypothetical protein [Streptomyces sp. NRRL B-24484]